MPAQSISPFPRPRRKTTYFLAIAGSGRFTMDARCRLETVIRHCCVAYYDVQVVVGCSTRFERQAARRVVALKRIFPGLSLTLLVTPSQQCRFRWAAEHAPGGALASLPASADRIEETYGSGFAYLDMKRICDLVLDCYAPAQRAEHKLLRFFVPNKVVTLNGRAVTLLTHAACLLALLCRLPRPGRLAEEWPASEE